MGGRSGLTATTLPGTHVFQKKTPPNHFLLKTKRPYGKFKARKKRKAAGGRLLILRCHPRTPSKATNNFETSQIVVMVIAIATAAVLRLRALAAFDLVNAPETICRRRR